MAITARRRNQTKTFPDKIWQEMPPGKYGWIPEAEVPEEIRALQDQQAGSQEGPGVQELSASEALYGFAGWLTMRRPQLVLSANDDAAPMAELVSRFIQAQGLQAPRDDWHKSMKPMGDDAHLLPPEPEQRKPILNDDGIPPRSIPDLEAETTGSAIAPQIAPVHPPRPGADAGATGDTGSATDIHTTGEVHVPDAKNSPKASKNGKSDKK